MKQLSKIINHAYQNSMLYQLKSQNLPDDITEETISTLPIITKQDITSGTPIETLDYIMGRIPEEEIGTMHTSGSTGICLPILWHKTDYMHSLLPLWMLRKKYYNISPQDKLCYFYTILENGGAEPTYVYQKNMLGFSKCGLQEERLLDIYQKMLDFQPKFLLLQPSLAELLLEVAQTHNLPRIESLEYIEFSGELLVPELRERVQAFFQCKIANQYGAYEVNSIAYECPNGNLHCMNSNVYVEVVDDNQQPVTDEQEGEIIVTSLHNHIMPFIRYRIGDKGRILHSKQCNCGNKNPILELTVGRSNDYIATKNGRKINPYIFVRAVERINKRMDNVVKQFQVEQTEYEEFQVHMRLDDNTVQQEVADLFANSILEPELEQAVYRFQFHDEFLNEDGKKLRYFKNDCESISCGTIP